LQADWIEVGRAYYQSGLFYCTVHVVLGDCRTVGDKYDKALLVARWVKNHRYFMLVIAGGFVWQSALFNSCRLLFLMNALHCLAR
jgi:hypothetical protein